MIGLTGCHWFSSEELATQTLTTEEIIEAVEESKIETEKIGEMIRNTESDSQSRPLEECKKQIDKATKNF